MYPALLTSELHTSHNKQQSDDNKQEKQNGNDELSYFGLELK